MRPIFLFLLSAACANLKSQNAVKNRKNAPPKLQSELQSEIVDVQVDVQEFTIATSLDHFDGSNIDTLTQRYFMRTDFRNSTSRNNYGFICCGGEGPELDSTVLTTSAHCTGDMIELASRLPEDSSITMFALEHRYYGKSFPSDVVMKSDEKFKFLSSRQAINDVANLVQFANENLMPANSQWVTFGGSYPGMVAGWSRSKFPHLIEASVSNSSPMQASVEMVQYNEVVGKDLADEYVGGSTECQKIVVEGHEQIVAIFESNNDEEILALAKTFNVCEPRSLLNIPNQHSFAGDGVVYVPAQENDPSCTTPECNIRGICSSLISSASTASSSLEALAQLSASQQGGDCVSVNAEFEAKYFKSDAAVTSGDASWLYQTCR